MNDITSMKEYEIKVQVIETEEHEIVNRRNARRRSNYRKTCKVKGFEGETEELKTGHQRRNPI